MTPSRRTVMKNAGWATPAVLATTLVPAYAASAPTTTQWAVTSQYEHPETIIVTSVNTYRVGNSPTEKSTGGIFEIYAHRDATVQDDGYIIWEVFLGLGESAQTDLVVTIPKTGPNFNWASTDNFKQNGLAQISEFFADQGYTALFTQEMPAAILAETADAYVLTFPTGSLSGSATSFTFRTLVMGDTPEERLDALLGGNSDPSVSSGDQITYSASAKVSFTPEG